MRKMLFWLHLTAGTLAGIVILIMSATGVLLTYQRQITAWADRGLRVEPGARRLAVEELLAKAREGTGGLPSSVTLKSDPREPAVLAYGRETVYANPYTAEVLPPPSTAARDFFRVVVEWHRYLGRGGDSRPVGKAITGASNAAFLFLVMSGLYLWWPRKWAQRITWFRGGLKGRARDFNWHNAIGFWTCVPLALIVIGSTLISYPAATNLLYRMTRSAPPPPNPPAGRVPADLDLRGLDAAWARAEEQVAGWRTISLRLPAAADAPLVFAIDAGDGGQPQKRSQLTLDRGGKILALEDFASYNLGRKLRMWFRFVHTGEAYGIPGQTIAGIASLGGVFLVWTGLALAWRRFRSWRARRGAPEAEQILVANDWR